MKIHTEELILDIINDYAFDLYLPDFSWDTGMNSNRFAVCSFTSFACKELIHRVLAYDGDNITDMLIDFVSEMEGFKKSGELAFKIAYNVGLDILEICRAAGIK